MNVGPKVLVTGSRGWTNAAAIARVLLSHNPSVVIHGGAHGADDLADRWARATMTPTKVYRPDWDAYGKRAGIVRNEHMLLDSKPDVVIAFWVSRVAPST